MTTKKQPPESAGQQGTNPIRDYVMGSDNVRDSNQAIANAMRARRVGNRAAARILVADEDPDGLERTSRILENEEFEVVRASNGKQVLAVLERSPADLIILNITMPGASGLEVISALRPLHPVTKVIALARPEEPSCYLEAARKFGAVRVLTRPVGRVALLKSVRTALGIGDPLA